MNVALPAAPPERTSRVLLSGELDYFGMKSVEDVMRSVDADRVILDLSAVRAISAAFVGELVRLHRRLPDAAIEFSGANRFVQRILDLLEVDEILRNRPLATS